jgi:phage major head subunit gpT-like protein
MSWQRGYRKTQVVDPATFDPQADYTARELEAYAEAILRQDAKANPDADTNILFDEHLYSRTRREIGNASGIADPTLTVSLQDKNKPGRHTGDGQMMYNRTHPRGRKVNSEEQRKRNGASYYR